MTTETQQNIHRLFLAAARVAIAEGATSADLADYFVQAAKGMKVNAAFKLKGADLLAALDAE